ncbi:MAG: hypothetical protein H0W43_05920 [Chthoniobacterales bacterium]|nr:hypothetical protein [Chthoniobacterales bacterium]
MNDTLIFFILAALALIFKWLTSKAENSQAEKEKRAAESGEPNEQAPPTLRPAPQSEEERVRRFLEALGMPQGTQPPPPVRQRRVVTPSAPQTPPAQRPKVKRSWAQPLPPLVTMPEDLRPPPLQTAPPPLPTMVHVEPPLAEIEDSLPPPAPVLPALRIPALQKPAPVMSLGAMLRSPASVRRAIVLREVLGPPRGLQPLDA